MACHVVFFVRALMTDLSFYHNPRCSKSRAALALLNERGLQPNIRLYLEQPVTPAELARLLHCLGLTARQVLRTGETAYRTLNLADETLTERALIHTICEYPSLLERPILRAGARAVIGRPPERVLELFA